MRYLVTVADGTIELDVERHADGSYSVRGVDGPDLAVTTMGNESGQVSLLVDGRIVEVLASEDEVRLGQERYTVHAESALHAATRAAAKGGSSSGQILASMPGRIVRVLCEAGSAVQAGTPLIVMEAMKMQNELCAKGDAVVRAVRVEVGQTVERGAALVEFE